MGNYVKVPNGEEQITIQLTKKELMALTGVKFQEDRSIERSARKKLQMAIEGISRHAAKS